MTSEELAQYLTLFIIVIAIGFEIYHMYKK